MRTQNKEASRLETYAALVEQALKRALPADAQEQVREAMAYSLLGGGKRLRGALVLEFARIASGSVEEALPLACSVEMIHAYSLIHDDLPCMDDDGMRRGKPSCHKKFGEACALLAGDALLTLAFETAVGANLPAKAAARAVKALSQAAGAAGMVGGQMLDLAAEGRQVTFPELQRLYAMKTGALLCCSAVLGCIAGGAPEEVEKTAVAYASALGLMFQYTDDLLDVTGDQKILGKPVGSDADNQKNTAVTLLGVEGAQKEARRQAEIAREQAGKLADAGFLIWLADTMLSRDH